MIRVYFDWQVLNWLKKYDEHPNPEEKKKYSRLYSKYCQYKNHLLIPYSSAHLYDLQHNWRKSEKSKKYTYEDIDFLSKISNNNCLLKYEEKQYAGPYIGHPREYFDAIKYSDELLNEDIDLSFKGDDSLSIAMRNHYSRTSPKYNFENIYKNIPEEHRDEFKKFIPFSNDDITLKELIEKVWDFSRRMLYDGKYYRGLRDYVIKNFKGIKTLDDEGSNIEEIDSFFRDSQMNQSFLELVKSTCALNNFNSKKEPTRYDIFKNAYLLLDTFGISTDKISKRNSFINITRDAEHAFFGAFCDFIVSEDKALRKKTKALYKLLDIGTKVLSVNQFNDTIRFLISKPLINYDEFFSNIIYTINHGIIKSKEINPNKGLAVTHYKLEGLVLNYFNELAFVQQNHYHSYFILNKKSRNYSYFSLYAETKYLVNQLYYIYGSDDFGKESFNYEKEIIDIEKHIWNGRNWTLNEIRIMFYYNYELKSHQLVLVGLKL